MKLRKIFAAVVLFLSAGTAMAQQMPAIPVDKNVKIGRLDNGLTYYIRHNSYPEHVASFYIAQKVGSINENDDQRGLAHLLEHLAFNGTDHFKGNSLQALYQRRDNRILLHRCTYYPPYSRRFMHAHPQGLEQRYLSYQGSHQ